MFLFFLLSASNRKKRNIVADYNVDNVSDKVVCAILSYTPYVRRVVWRES